MKLQLCLILGLVCLLAVGRATSDHHKDHHEDHDDHDDHDDERKDETGRRAQRPSREQTNQRNNQQDRQDLHHDHQQQHEKFATNQYKPQLKDPQQHQQQQQQQQRQMQGRRQSPIAINRREADQRRDEHPLQLSYPQSMSRLNLSNTGTTWELQISQPASLAEGHLSNAYRLKAIHCHWGDDDDEGSEHTVDGRQFSGELHFVHYNEQKYGTYERAKRAEPDGLVVLGVFLDAKGANNNNNNNNDQHRELDKIVDELKLIQSKGQSTLIRQPINLNNLLPKNKSYWSYPGSLTTPGFSEVVTWFVLKEPIRVGRSQVDKFRRLRGLGGRASGPIKENYRRTQPLNGRTIVSHDQRSAGGAKR